MASLKELRDKVSILSSAAKTLGWSEKDRLVLIGAITEAFLASKKKGRPANIVMDSMVGHTYEMVQELEGPMSQSAACFRVAEILDMSLGPDSVPDDLRAVVARHLRKYQARKMEQALKPPSTSSFLADDTGQK